MILAALVLVGCPATDGSPDFEITEPTPSDFPVRLHATPLQMPPARKNPPRPEPTDGRYIYVPASGRVEWGRPYRFHIYVHCGMDPLVDFDGSFWDADEIEARDFLFDYFRHIRWARNRVFGTMIVLPPGDSAVFRAGNNSRLHFKRHPEPSKVAGICF